MNNNRSWSNLGEQFKTAVQDALDSGDFSELNFLVTDTVATVIDEAGDQVVNAYKSVNQQDKRQRNEQISRDIQRQKVVRREFSYQQYNTARSGNYRQPTVYAQKNTLPSTKVKQVGQVSSVLYLVFGSIGCGCSALALLMGGFFGAIGLSWSGGVIAFLVVLLVGFILMICKGVVQSGRLKRMKRYISLFANKMYINIEDLARQANKTSKYILKDVKQMLKLGFFPEGHLDEKETCLMLDDATYREYLKVEKERKVLAAEENAKIKEQQNAQKIIYEAEGTDAELQTMIREGKEYIRKLHELNDLIEGEVISEKMYRMEDLLKEIFARVAEHPEQMPQMHRLMNYYLPTTIKLFTAYEEFDHMSAPGEDVIKAKAQIEQTVDTINEAFEELLNKLFQDTVFDATTDAQVLQTMLAQDGLKKKEF